MVDQPSSGHHPLPYTAVAKRCWKTYRTTSGLVDLDGRALPLAGGIVVAATISGNVRKCDSSAER